MTGDNAANSLAPQPTCSTNYTVTSAVGTYTTSCTGAAATNYTITTVAGSFKVLFLWDGFLQPINDTAHDVHTTAPFSKFKLGQTIPAKFDLKDANGNAGDADGQPDLQLHEDRRLLHRLRGAGNARPGLHAVVSAALHAERRALPVQLEHKGLQVGLYSIYANLADGTSRTVNICFAK